jgi:hypothetical protein
MVYNNKIDLSYRAKIQHVSELINKIKSKVSNISRTSILNSDAAGLSLLEESLNNLIKARSTMKEEFEKSKLKQLSFEASEVLENHKSFMQHVNTQKKIVVKFSEITAVKVKKKKKGNPFN